MILTKTLFYDRCGVLVTPQAHSVIKPRRGAWTLAKSEDSVMMLWPESTHGIPDLPGGGVDEGESLDAAAQREWFEETGLPFEPAGVLINTYHHVRGFYADGQGEFWVYDQTFFLYAYDRTQSLGERWRNPEGGLVGWVSFENLKASCLNRAHWLAVEALVPKDYYE